MTEETIDRSTETKYWQDRIDSANAPIDTSKHVKIYRFIPDDYHNLLVAPVAVDYSTGLNRSLFRQREFDKKGRLIKTMWFADEDRKDLIVDVVRSYEFDSFGWPTVETITSQWYCEDGTVAKPNKVVKKLYSDQLAKIAAAERWRSNQIKVLKMKAIELIVYTSEIPDGYTPAQATGLAVQSGQSFLSEHKLAFVDYVEDNNPTIIAILMNAKNNWLDNEIPMAGVTIRQYLLSGLQ